MEFLMLSLVSLALLSISIGALISTRSLSIKMLEILGTKADSSKVLTAIEQVCTLGPGNQQSLQINEPFTISNATSNLNSIPLLIRVGNTNFGINKNIFCKFSNPISTNDPFPIAIQGSTITIKNTNGKIDIS